jgi:threonine synthase
LYPDGKISEIQEKQLSTFTGNVRALKVKGTFDDCQKLLKTAFTDEELRKKLRLSSANSINIARLLPQSFYYMYAACVVRNRAALDNKIHDPQIIMVVPSGNFGNICSALFDKKMGLPIKRFIAANNANDIFFKYLQTGKYEPKASVQTIANAMDVGDPSNFARVYELYGKSHAAICADISGATYTDGQIAETIKKVKSETGYVCDPHGACGFQALQDGLNAGEVGVFLETAHPAKFKDTVDGILNASIEIPAKLQAFMKGTKQSVPMSKDFSDFKKFLLSE